MTILIEDHNKQFIPFNKFPLYHYKQIKDYTLNQNSKVFSFLNQIVVNNLLLLIFASRYIKMLEPIEENEDLGCTLKRWSNAKE